MEARKIFLTQDIQSQSLWKTDSPDQSSSIVPFSVPFKDSSLFSANIQEENGTSGCLLVRSNWSLWTTAAMHSLNKSITPCCWKDFQCTSIKAGITSTKRSETLKCRDSTTLPWSVRMRWKTKQWTLGGETNKKKLVNSVFLSWSNCWTLLPTNLWRARDGRNWKSWPLKLIEDKSICIYSSDHSDSSSAYLPASKIALIFTNYSSLNFLCFMFTVASKLPYRSISPLIGIPSFSI